jgi:hypothetical protein
MTCTTRFRWNTVGEDMSTRRTVAAVITGAVLATPFLLMGGGDIPTVVFQVVAGLAFGLGWLVVAHPLVALGLTILLAIFAWPFAFLWLLVVLVLLAVLARLVFG